jgi:hypothetical protein
MALAIAWRNPNPVHTIKRCIKFGKGTLSDIYVVQELIAGANWSFMSVLEVLCSGHVEAPRAPYHASRESRAAGSYQAAAIGNTVLHHRR